MITINISSYDDNEYYTHIKLLLSGFGENKKLSICVITFLFMIIFILHINIKLNAIILHIMTLIIISS